MDVPVVNFESVSIKKDDNEITKDDFINVAKEIWKGFTEIGFLYIQNHGIPEAQIDQIFKISDDFFNLSDEVKRKYAVDDSTYDKHGYVPMNKEILGKYTTQEHRESYNFMDLSSFLPENELPGFTGIINNFFHKCGLVTLRVLRAIAIALKLEDEDYFAKNQLPMDTADNFTTLRLLNYPPISSELGFTQDVVRCGEHSDYGLITLLFQDETGGLEVKTRKGDFIKLGPLQGTILVNVGNILDYMTHGTLTAARHRVLLNDAKNHKRRRSIAFFAHPVHSAKLERLTEPKDTTTLTSYEFVKNFFDSTYVRSLEI